MSTNPDSPQRTDPIAIGFLVLAPLLWSGNFVVGRAIGGEIDPLVLNWLRWVLAGLVVLPVLVSARFEVRAAWRNIWWRIIALGALGVMAFNWLLYEALVRMSASVAALMVGLTPVLILLISALFLGRRITLVQVLGSLVALGGVALVVLGGAGLASVTITAGGLGFSLAAALSWAVYTLLLKQWKLPLRPVVSLSLSIWAGVALMTPLLGLLGQFPEPGSLGWPEVLAILYLGFGASLLAFFSWQSGVLRIGPARAGVFLQLIPVFTLLLAAALLGEGVSVVKLAGLMLVISGVVLTERS